MDTLKDAITGLVGVAQDELQRIRTDAEEKRAAWEKRQAVTKDRFLQQSPEWAAELVSMTRELEQLKQDMAEKLEQTEREVAGRMTQVRQPGGGSVCMFGLGCAALCSLFLLLFVSRHSSLLTGHVWQVREAVLYEMRSTIHRLKAEHPDVVSARKIAERRKDLEVRLVSVRVQHSRSLCVSLSHSSQAHVAGLRQMIAGLKRDTLPRRGAGAAEEARLKEWVGEDLRREAWQHLELMDPGDILSFLRCVAAPVSCVAVHARSVKCRPACVPCVPRVLRVTCCATLALPQ